MYFGRILLVSSVIAGTVYPLLGDTLQLSGTGAPYVSQTGVYRVERDIFRNGGHGWRTISPTNSPNNYVMGSDTVGFDLASTLSSDATIESATLNWSFSNLSAVSGGTVGIGLNWPKTADIPRVHGSTDPCAGSSVCTPASLDRFDPNFNFFADHLTLEGVSSYTFGSQYGVASGSVNLLGTWSGHDLATHKLDFVGSVIFNLGRPYFNGEGLNADTEFDVNGHAQADEMAVLTVEFTEPTPTPTPEPLPLVSTGMVLAGIAFLILLRRKTRKA